MVSFFLLIWSVQRGGHFQTRENGPDKKQA